jgi:transcriptional regulator with XRE-family HTH domain
MDIRRQLARNLKRLRTEKGWSQEELADQAGLHRTYVSGVERGVRNPTITIVATLAKALGVPAIRAFGGALSIPHSLISAQISLLRVPVIPCSRTCDLRWERELSA